MRIAGTAVGLLVFATALPLAAQDPGREAKDTVAGTVELRQDTQASNDAWARERSHLLDRYRGLQSELVYLEQRTAAETERVTARQARADELRRRLAESTRLEASLQDTLDVICGRLESWVAADAPFLPGEREARLAALRRELSRPEASPGEKLRRLLEALQVETGYGATVEVYQDRIAAGGEELFVDVLRLGRLALFWRTPDAKRAGWHDPAAGTWTELPRRYRRSIGLALEMASRMRPVEPVSLPLGRIAP
ncbi:DUF3450 domain-containing protein [bacterium]|nr:DUF3450 domain-containing protein [bacterium]MBU1072959.1 DUF3450 domain-containing protein [bacterium]MBU1675185.1 DUF3450 domain-containing protein [bacterium]